MLFFLEFTQANIGTLPTKKHNSKQCSLFWHIVWQAEASKTPWATVKSCFIVAWQCPSTHYSLNCWNPLATALWKAEASPI
jgi:hypothetical protein